MSKKLLYVLAGLFLLFVALWWTRYQVVGMEEGAYRINRFTGSVQLILANQIIEVEKYER